MVLWPLALAGLLGGAWVVDNKFWAENAFLLNVASAGVGAAFGIPIAVAFLRTVTERGAERAATVRAARMALRDAQAVRTILAQHWRCDVEALLVEIDRHYAAFPVNSGLTPGEYSTRQAAFRAAHMEAVRELGLRDVPARLPDHEDQVRLDNLHRSLSRLRDEAEVRSVAPMWKVRPDSWGFVKEYRTAAASLVSAVDRSDDELFFSGIGGQLGAMRRALDAELAIDRFVCLLIDEISRTWPAAASD